jgi:hypothetical protein
MVIHRIAPLACALCFALPAAAGASPAIDPPTGHTVDGNTQATAPQDTVKAKGPYGITTATGPADTSQIKGPYGITTSTGPADTGKAKGPYGITTATGPVDTSQLRGPYGLTPATGAQVAAAATAHPAGAAARDDTNDWRSAAIAEAALLAALVLGAALLVSARRRVPRLGT